MKDEMRMAEIRLSSGAGQTPLDLESFPLLQPNARSLKDHRIVGFDSRDLRSRPFNLLRTRLIKTFDAQNVHLAGLTSATPSAGKSFLSLNLAGALARLGERPIYLVDVDLRRASLAEQLNLEVEKGVDSFLQGHATELEEIGLRVEGLPLVVFPTNLVRGNSAELVSGELFSRLVEQFRSRSANAIVLFDLPPVFANDDAMLSIEALDGYVMVVDSGKTNRRQVTDAMQMLLPSPCLGTILNRYKGGVLDSYGYSYGNYNRYYDR